METVISPTWEQLIIDDDVHTIVVIGESDTGKSTLARYLFARLCKAGVRAAYLDADVGQSTLGLPTTQTVALASEAGDGTFPPGGACASFFLGDVTPRGHLLPTVVGARRLADQARAWGAGVTVVDTTGLVDPAQGGKALKQWKIELLAPELVVALQRERELEPILWPLRRDGRVRVAELPVVPQVRRRSREARIAHRESRLARYFAGARTQTVNLRRTAVYDLGRLAPGALLAFQDVAGLVLALGVVDSADRAGGTAQVRTPLKSLEAVASLRIGVARWER
ncbi:MAG TPA: polynucleotide 5'-hydroxyl-kinase [Anaerolineae bacterium]|nr:polynucleotide 5'-hydroxyl-kinase [Anaerolineae bacterium]